jgi:hypothetical protein
MDRSWCVDVLNDLSDQVLCSPNLYCCAKCTKDIIIINLRLANISVMSPLVVVRRTNGSLSL